MGDEIYFFRGGGVVAQPTFRGSPEQDILDVAKCTKLLTHRIGDAVAHG